MRERGRLSLLAFGLLVLPCAVLAQGFDVTILRMDVGGVGASIQVREPLIPLCPGANCGFVEYRVSISPCPIDVPCLNGKYEYVAPEATFYKVALAFDYGVTYNITGTYNSRWGTRTGSVCNHACINTGNLGPATLIIPTVDQRPRWEASPVSTEDEMVWVDVRLVGSHLDVSECAQNADCVDPDILYRITPCPLAIENAAVEAYCSDGTMSFLDMGGAEVKRFAFQNGLTYTINGFAVLYGNRSEMSGACVERDCDFVEVPLTITYTASALSSSNATWGHVKSLYRK